jgi:hypothetical protein
MVRMQGGSNRTHVILLASAATGGLVLWRMI